MKILSRLNHYRIKLCRQKWTLILLEVLFLTAGGVIVTFNYLNTTRNDKTVYTDLTGNETVMLAKPTERIRPLPHGLIPFTISSGKATGPLITNGVLEPIDPAPGQIQRILVTVKPRKSAITAVSISVNSDNSTSELPVQREPDSDRWVGTWVPDDTFTTRYTVDISAKDQHETNDITITIR